MTTGQEPMETPQAGGDQQQQAGSGQEPEKFDASYVKQLRAEAASYRKRLADLEAKAKQDEDAKLSEADQLKKKLAELEAAAAQSAKVRQEQTTRYEVMLAASKLGIVDPDAAYRLLDQSTLEYGEDGAPKNIEAALKAMVGGKPWLVGGTGSGGSAANPNATKTGRLSMEDIKRMPQDEINRRWDEVSAVLSGGKS